MNGYDRHRRCLLVTWFLTASENAYPFYILIPYEELYSSYLVEDCFLNFVNEHGTIVMSSFQKLAVKCKVHMVHAILIRELEIVGN